MFDAVLLAGFSYLAYHIFKLDWPYWQHCPYPYHWYLLVQYLLLAAVMRIPVLTIVSPNT